MARLTILHPDGAGAVSAELSLEITYARFEYGWVYYDIYPAFGGQPILNGAALKTSQNLGPARSGALSACEDEFCSLLPAMRRFVETGVPGEWTPIEPDVTLTMAPDEGSATWVNLVLEIDTYQWRGVTAYGGPMVSITFDCTLAAIRQFYKDLRGEFLIFRDANDIVGYNIANRFDRPEHEWF